MIFVDTGALYALVVADDPGHAKVAAWYNANHQPLVTTDYCVDELLTLLVVRKRQSLAISTGHKIFNGDICSLRFVVPSDVHRAWILFQQRAAAGWSFTDCTSKIVIGDLGIQAAAALDDHFRQFGIAIVPSPLAVDEINEPAAIATAACTMTAITPHPPRCPPFLPSPATSGTHPESPGYCR